MGRNPEGKRHIGRILLKLIRMDLVQVGWGDEGWIGLAQARDRWRALVNSVLNIRVVGWKARGKEATRKTKT
jgi:hypothetical protein